MNQVKLPRPPQNVRHDRVCIVLKHARVTTFHEVAEVDLDGRVKLRLCDAIRTGKEGYIMSPLDLFIHEQLDQQFHSTVGRRRNASP